MDLDLAGTWTVTHGGSIDLAENVPVPSGVDPRTDGSRYVLWFKAVPDDVEAWLAFDSSYPNRCLTIDGYDQPSGLATVSFRASARAARQVPVGSYVGLLMQERPRDGAFEAQRTLIKTITLTVQGGTS